MSPQNTATMDSETVKKKNVLDKKTIDIIRTTQRNNIDLTAIADNKANVLLSLNALVIAVLVPLILTNIDHVVDRFLYVPLMILAATCFSTIFIAAQVLKPSDFDSFREPLAPNSKPSPFFFGNFYQQTPGKYFEDIKDSLSNSEMIRAHLAQDLYYVGKRLGTKMSLVRRAYNIFIVGIGLTLLSAFLVTLFTSFATS